MAAKQSAGQGSRLGGARADFVAGLGRKVGQLRVSLVQVRENPSSGAARDELRRKLRALSASARLMKFDVMDRALAEALGTLDRAAVDEALNETDIGSLEQVLEDLPTLAWGDDHARSSRIEIAAVKPTHHALVVGSHLISEALLERLDDPMRPTFGCESTPDAQAAFDLAHALKPDLVLIDADLEDASELVEALMDDPRTEMCKIVVVGSFLEAGEASRYVAMGVARTLQKPTSRDALRATCEEVLFVAGRPVSKRILGEPTLAELGERLALEVKEALLTNVDAIERNRKIPLGEGAEVLGALWGAIARVREVVTARTDGDIRFATGPDGAMPIAMTELDRPQDPGHANRTSSGRGADADVRLEGRKIVVADDDPAVVWFIADLLKSAGCNVHEALDGRSALEVAYRTSPDLVVSDILMPKLDGFSLCRALRRDVALRDVPVILLSWKEDLLQRVRELGVSASGYVRKESDSRAILARVREALHTRAKIEKRLREPGDFRGRLDGLSVRTLLEMICAARTEARISIRDASFVYEVEIRGGEPHRATRTSGDGGILRGPRVLASMLGVSAGRFSLTTSTSVVEADLHGTLAEQLAEPIACARASTRLLTGHELLRVQSVRFDEEGLADYLRATPLHAKSVIERLVEGAIPHALVLEGACESSLLEDLAFDLASRGLVVGVEGQGGTDLLGPEIARYLGVASNVDEHAIRLATPSPVCALDTSASACDSPTAAGSSLEDALLNAVSMQSPAPAQLPLPLLSEASEEEHRERATKSTRPKRSHEGTPSPDQILALAEPTVVDNVTYGEKADEEEEDEIDVVVASEAAPEAKLSETSSTKAPVKEAVEDAVEEAAGLPKKRKFWPFAFFVIVMGALVWAALRFGPAGVARLEVHLPNATSEFVRAVPAPNENAASIVGDEGSLEISVPDESVVVVDGKERGHGTSTIAVRPGSHDVRVGAISAAQAMTRMVDVQSHELVRLKF